MSMTRREILCVVWGAGTVAATAGAMSLLPKAIVPQTPSMVKVTRASDDGWLITQAERTQIESADALVTSDILDIRDAVDLPGGDYRAERVSGLGECVNICEADSACEAFTYARNSHPLPEKRRMCWMKSANTETEVTNTRAYVSGRRDSW